MSLLGGAALLVAVVGVAYLALASVLTLRFGARAPEPPAFLPPVTILKPLHGAEPGLLANLLSFTDQEYGGSVQIVLGLQDERDPAIAVVRELQRLRPDRDIALVVDARLHGANRKVSNLINMAESARHEVVVLADSDMRVGPDYVARLTAALERPGVGAVTCLYHGVASKRDGSDALPSPLRGGVGGGGRGVGAEGRSVSREDRAIGAEPEPASSTPPTPTPSPSPQGGREARDVERSGSAVWSRLSALSIDTHFLPSVVTGLSLGLATPCMGSTIALRRETLDRIGGFRALADTLADDYELGAAVRRLGLTVAVPPFAIGHVCAERSLRDLVAQELRWVRTIRLIDPAGHAGTAVAHPVAFAFLGLGLLPGFTAFAIFAAACLARIGVCLAVERAFGLHTHPYWLVPARDLLSAAIYVASFFGRGVSWRGRGYQVARSGAMTPKARLP